VLDHSLFYQGLKVVGCHFMSSVIHVPSRASVSCIYST